MPVESIFGIYYHTLRIHICSKISGFPRTKSEKTCGWDETRPPIHPKFSGGVWILFFFYISTCTNAGNFSGKNSIRQIYHESDPSGGFWFSS